MDADLAALPDDIDALKAALAIERARPAGPILEVGCWAHARRPFSAMADVEENGRRRVTGRSAVALSPIAIEVVRRIDALFEIERSINGKSAEERRTVRHERSKTLVEELQVYMREQRAKLSRGHDLAKAVDYILKRWKAFTLFLDDGRACLSNNAAERALRGIALGRRSWMFYGSDRGGQRAAAMYSLIVTATRYEDGFLFTGFCIDICSRRPKRSHGERIPLVRLTYKRH
jgi:transposase